MSVNQEDTRGNLGSGEHEVVMPSRWWRVAAVSSVLWILLSLPLLAMSSRVLILLRMNAGAFAKNIGSMDFVMTTVMFIVSPLPLISGISTLAFLSTRSARWRRRATFCLRLSLVGMTALIATGIAMAIEGERMGGDTGPLQVIVSILIGVALPILIIIPSTVGLISLWRLKHTISK